MTLEHLYFIPFVLSLGLVLGSQLTRWRFARVATLPRRVTVRGVPVPLVRAPGWADVPQVRQAPMQTDGST